MKRTTSDHFSVILERIFSYLGLYYITQIILNLKGISKSFDLLIPFSYFLSSPTGSIIDYQPELTFRKRKILLQDGRHHEARRP